MSPPMSLPVQPTVDSKGDTSSKVEDDPEEQRPHTPPNVPSALSADATQSPASAWYTPWSWYQSPSTTVVSSSTADAQKGPNAPPSSSPESAKRDPDGGNEQLNRAGWLSFFSARAMAMKSITYDKDGGGEMEVMEIDVDEAASTPGPSLTTAATQPSPSKDTKPTLAVPVQPLTPVAQPSSPAPKKPDETKPTSDSANRQPSPTPSKKSGVKTPTTVPPPPNLVLPTWEDVFHSLPRSSVPQPPPSALSRTLQYVSGVLFARDEGTTSKKGKGKGKATDLPCSPYEKALPRAWDVLEGGEPSQDVLRGCSRVVVIGVHGWFPGAVMRTVLGEPTGTSSKFVNRVVQALDQFQERHKVKFTKVTGIPLEGEGTINRRVERLYQNLTANKEWMDDLREADAIFIATHSQGSVVSTHLLDRLIAHRHIRTARNNNGADASVPPPSCSSSSSGGVVASGSTIPETRPPQRICCLALCGIHLGPLRYLSTSSLLQPYIQYFESTAARELFEFQNTESTISKDYVRALRNVLDNGIKMVYIASLNDQVVGLYSGLFTSVSHPLILRALYIDGDAYHSSDFLSNLLVLLLRIRNAGLSDSGLLTHLSEATAGSLNGIGHSTAYEELATYSLAINYMFLADSGQQQQQQHEHVELVSEPFNALTEQNDYEIPWALRDLIADDRVARLFADEFVLLRDAFRDWQPRTAILRDVKRKLQPIQRLSSSRMMKIAPHAHSISKL
ncbi:hypothetical protein F5I97DRAFT_1939240 [Phlebopus sp. FC_14]|nr:hypothetical protein F5I97DRAFT_1939240 [Phlebopus sp. FC_14]